MRIKLSLPLSYLKTYLVYTRLDWAIRLVSIGRCSNVAINFLFVCQVNVLLQAYISHLKLEGFALMSDMVYVTQVSH